MRIIASIFLILFSLASFASEDIGKTAGAVPTAVVIETTTVDLVDSENKTEVGPTKPINMFNAVIGAAIGAGIFAGLGWLFFSQVEALLVGLLFGAGFGAILSVNEDKPIETTYHELYLVDTKTKEEKRIRFDSYPLSFNAKTNLVLRKYSDGSYTLRKAEK